MARIGLETLRTADWRTFFPDEYEDAAVRKSAGRDHCNVEVMEKEILAEAVVLH
jgi:hypothetical protein